MGAPKFGVIYSRLHPIIAPDEFGRQAEAAGYDSLWVTEGLANQKAALDPVVTMMCIAQGTTRATVGSSVILLPLRTPAIFAKEIASLDVLSRGRVVLGVGVGASSLSNPADFRAGGVDPSERGARCDEILDAMINLWRGEPTTHRGRFFDFDDIVLLPTPVQTPHPPLWMGGDAPGVVRRTARVGNGFIPMTTGAARYRELWEQVARTAETMKRDPASITRALHVYCCMGDHRDQAHATVERTLSERYGFPVSLKDDGGLLTGSAEDCERVVESYIDAGVEHFVLNIARPLIEVPENMMRFAAEVLPKFR